MSKYLPHYDELYVVSDLHMGGEKLGARDFQIFNRGQRLANLVDHIRQNLEGEVALVLNGDIIDSLAEDLAPDYVALDTDKVLKMMERIYGDPSFAMVWKAFANLVRTKKRTLVFVIGNHDIELALPPVEAFLRDRLAGGDVAANSRLVFATHGGGFACTVGGARVFCTHGNEVDLWNMVDYTALGLLANAMNAGRRPDAARWTPNAGTRLVIDVMNKVKRSFPFVDLLKPETKPVLAALFTIEPGLMKQIDLASAFPILREIVSGNLKTRNLLSAGENLSDVSSADVADAMMTEILGPSLAGKVDEVRSKSGEDALLLEAGLALNDPVVAARASAQEEAGTLGVSDIVTSWFGLVDKVEGLRRALVDWLKDDKTFDTSQPDSTYDDIIERVGLDVDYVVTGHTHLAREIEFKPKRYYYNCGTWIRLLRLTNQALTAEEGKVFREVVYPALEKGTMAALDAAQIPSKEGKVSLVYDRTNVVRIADANGAVKGELLRVTDGAQGKVKLVPEPKPVAS